MTKKQILDKSARHFLKTIFATASTAAILISSCVANAEDTHEACRAAMEACVASTGVTLTRPERGTQPTDAQKADMDKLHACMEAKNLKCGRGPGPGGFPHGDRRGPPPAGAEIAQ
jgi:hypothetical protein